MFPKIRSCAATLPIPSNSMTQSPRRSAKSKRATNSAPVTAANLSDLNKGDDVMIVATPGTQDGGVTAITLLAGVEPILEASPKNGQSILSPWSLSSGGGEAAAP